MSDFGSDVGNSSMSLMTKLMEALLKLIEKIYDAFMERRGVDYKLKKAEYGEMKDRAAQRKFVERIEGKTGYVNLKALKKAGVPLTSLGISLDDKGFKELAARCKREGIVITGVEDVRERELNGKKNMVVECKQSDLISLKNLIDLMNDEKRIDKVQEEIEKMQGRNQELATEIAFIKRKDEGLAQDDHDKIAELQGEIEENNLVVNELNKQIAEIRYGHSRELNQEQAYGVCEQAVNGETQRGVAFDKAVDRWTGGSIDKDTTCYVVDAKDPHKYIVCTAKNDIFKEQEYIKTTYEVYNGSKQVYATNDRRFEGRPRDYWTKEKSAMREAGGFSDLVLKFYSVEELQAYRENYKAQNASELDSLGFGKEGRDYDGIIQNLEAKMDECGGVYKDGVTVNKETGKPITLSEGMNDVARAKAAEASVIGKQIANYKDISRLESTVAIARTNVLTTDEGTPEHVAAKEEFEIIESAYKKSLITEASLIDERKSVNAVQAEQDVRISPVKDIELLPEDKEQLAALESKIAEQDNWLYEYVQEIGYSEDWRYKNEVMRPQYDKAKEELAALKAQREEIKEKAARNVVEAGKTDNISPVKDIELLPEDKEQLAALESKIAEQDNWLYEYGQEMAYSEDWRHKKEVMRPQYDKAKEELAALKAQREEVKEKAARNVVEAGKPDDRRDDRVAEVELDKRTMAEYKGEVADRKKDGAKGSDVRDREATKQKAIPKHKEDR